MLTLPLLLVRTPSHVCLLTLLTAILLSTGCRTADTGHLSQRERDLAGVLGALDATVDRTEAEQVAECALQTALQLARDYRAVRPAWFNNLLVNSGLRERGLCYDWADDLAASLRRLGLRSLTVHMIVASPGNWREHNGVAITAADKSPLEGLLLDAWRHGGQLYWLRVKEDKYPWEISQDEPAPVGSLP